MINCEIGLEIPVETIITAINTNETNISTNTQNINTKEPNLGLGTAGQVLSTNQAADAKEWITLPPFPEAPEDDIPYVRKDSDWIRGVDSGTISSTIIVNHIRTCTQSEYDNLTPVEDILYLIVG